MAKKVSAIPKGFHTATPYLIVRDGAGALEYYKKAFGAVVGFEMKDENGDLRHADFQVGSSKFMIGQHTAVDARTQGNFPGVSIYLHVENSDEVFARAVEAGAKVINPVTEKFYGVREGGLEDPFGIVWWIATRVKLWKPDGG